MPEPAQSLKIIESSGCRDISTWVADNPDWQRQFYEHGALLFRGFGTTDTTSFEAALDSLMQPTSTFAEETSPRSGLTDRVFTSTDYPPSFPIQFHHEFSYRRTYPERLAFCCIDPGAAGGATPLADSRRVLNKIPRDVADRFERLGVMYVRNYGELGVSWSESFGITDKEAVSDYCHAQGMDFSWDGEYLQTRQVGPAVTIHRVTAERVWFNSIVNLSIAGIEPVDVREAMMSMPPDSLPVNTFYGSGEPIAPSVLSDLKKIYQEEAIRFDWQAGDVLLIDNVLTAHARDPFEGPRSIVVAMGVAPA
jgi:Taurine catabolism dioxygenase TauD, TfdA family